jgi:RNA polymerase sigma factor for flagellar operon FliA
MGDMERPPSDSQDRGDGRRPAGGDATIDDPRSPVLHARDQLADELWIAYRTRSDARSLDALVVHYLPLVRAIARRAKAMLPPEADLDDLVGDGTFGLIDAVRRYDPTTGHAFSTYATLRIRGAILDGLRAADWVPRSLRASARQIERAMDDLERALGRSPNEGELADRLGISRELCRRLLHDIRRASVASLEEEEIDPPVADPTEQLASLLVARQTLPPREAFAVELHDILGYPLTEVARRLHVSHSRAFQIHEHALDLLRRALRSEAEDDGET